MVQQSYSLCLTNSVFAPQHEQINYIQLLNQGFWGTSFHLGKVPKIIEGRPTIGTPSGTNHKWYLKGITIPPGKSTASVKSRSVALPSTYTDCGWRCKKAGDFLEVGMG